MGLAIEQAKIAWAQKEVPIGAIVVREVVPSSSSSSSSSSSNTTQRTFEILSKGHNQVETQYDATSHAETNALRSASSTISNWRLVNTTLYTTMEPCVMCLSAALAFRVKCIVYGAIDKRLGAIETYIRLLDVVEHPYHTVESVVGGIRGEECGNLVRDFF